MYSILNHLEEWICFESRRELASCLVIGQRGQEDRSLVANKLPIIYITQSIHMRAKEHTDISHNIHYFIVIKHNAFC